MTTRDTSGSFLLSGLILTATILWSAILWAFADYEYTIEWGIGTALVAVVFVAVSLAFCLHEVDDEEYE